MRKPDILMIGSGGREDALGQAFCKSPLVGDIFYAPGNAGMPRKFRCDVRADDMPGLVALAKRKVIGLAVVGPEVPLALGLVDDLREAGILAFGPDKFCAQLESSKLFMKLLCDELGLPTAPWGLATTSAEARAYLAAHPDAFVVKADGLCAGKGAVVTHSLEEAQKVADDMLVRRIHGSAGNRIILEKLLRGREVSVIGLVVGSDVILFPLARDYKRAFDGDEGQNTGGMGAYSPEPLDPALLEEIRKRFFLPTIRAMAARGHSYCGFLYGGFMLTDEGPMLLEWNVRFGDPEAQAILPRVKSDLLELIIRAVGPFGLRRAPPLVVSDQVSVCIALTDANYPGTPRHGLPIKQLGALPRGVTVFHGGTEHDVEGKLVTAGGRVMYVTAMADTFPEARLAALAAAESIWWEGRRYRSDIAAKIV